MSLWALIALVFVVLVGAVAVLVYAAVQGSMMAVIVLTVLGVCVLFWIFQSYNLAFQLLRDLAERQRAKDDMKEDMQMMHLAFKTQGQMADAQRRLYAGQATGQKLLSPAEATIAPDLFSDFDVVEGEYE